MRVLTEIKRLRSRQTGPPTAGEVLDVLASEVLARLAFETALRCYLEEAGANPFAAADELLAFLNDDLG